MSHISLLFKACPGSASATLLPIVAVVIVIALVVATFVVVVAVVGVVVG